MAQVTLPYSLTAGTPENVNNLVANLNALRDGVNTIDTAQIASSAVTDAKLASNSVTTAKIKDGDVTAAKLASGAGGSLKLVTTVTVSSASSVNVDNCFTSTYSNYKIFCTAMKCPSAAGYVEFVPRASGTNNSSNVIEFVTGYPSLSNPTSTPWIYGNAAFAKHNYFGYASSTAQTLVCDLYSPQKAEYTGMFNAGFLYLGSSGFMPHAVIWKHSTQYDGFSLSFPGNTSGTIQIYGYGE